GNNDPFTYVLSAAWFREHGLLSFPRGPLWHATADNNLLIQDPRWLPMLHLSFFSSMLRVDPARLFTSIQTLGFALQLPLVWLLGQRVFGLAGVGLGAGFLLALLNPYPYYIAFHGFMPQVFGTGFFFSFLIVLPAFLEDQRFNLRDAMLLTLLGAGLFASYLELAPFAAFVLAAYAVCTAIRQGSWLHRLGRAVLVAGGVAALSPLQLRLLQELDVHLLLAAARHRAGNRDGGRVVPIGQPPAPGEVRSGRAPHPGDCHGYRQRSLGDEPASREILDARPAGASRAGDARAPEPGPGDQRRLPLRPRLLGEPLGCLLLARQADRNDIVQRIRQKRDGARRGGALAFPAKEGGISPAHHEWTSSGRGDAPPHTPLLFRASRSG